MVNPNIRAVILTPFVVAWSAHAASVEIINPGFEDVSQASVTYNEFTFGSLTGWNYHDPSGTKGTGQGATYFAGTLRPTVIAVHDPVNPQYFPGGAPQGDRVAIAFNYAGSGGSGEYGLQQTLSATLQLNTVYTLSALVGNIASGFSVDGTFFDLNGFPGYRIDLMAGSTVLASDNNSLAGSIAEGQFALISTMYHSGASNPLAGQNLTIRLVNLNLIDPGFPAANLEVDFDQIMLDATAVPELGTAGLLVMGLAPVILGRRRR